MYQNPDNTAMPNEVCCAIEPPAATSHCLHINLVYRPLASGNHQEQLPAPLAYHYTPHGYLSPPTSRPQLSPGPSHPPSHPRGRSISPPPGRYPVFRIMHPYLPRSQAGCPPTKLQHKLYIQMQGLRGLYIFTYAAPDESMQLFEVMDSEPDEESGRELLGTLAVEDVDRFVLACHHVVPPPSRSGVQKLPPPWEGVQRSQRWTTDAIGEVFRAGLLK